MAEGVVCIALSDLATIGGGKTGERSCAVLHEMGWGK
jgi:hypothetical protein